MVTFLRSIPFALYRRDRKLSPTHDTVIREWWARTQPTTTPVLRYVKRARDRVKEGGLNSIAVRSDLRIGEGPNAEVIRRDYDVDHIDENERHDMLAKLRDTSDWLQRN